MPIPSAPVTSLSMTVPIDISVTAFIPSVYQNYLELMRRYDIEHVPTRFSYTVHYDGGVYAHDFESPLKAELMADIERFKRLLAFLKRSVGELGQSVVMVTHDPRSAAYADRVVFLADGNVVSELSQPTADSVLERMRTLGA